MADISAAQPPTRTDASVRAFSVRIPDEELTARQARRRNPRPPQREAVTGVLALSLRWLSPSPRYRRALWRVGPATIVRREGRHRIQAAPLLATPPFSDA